MQQPDHSTSLSGRTVRAVLFDYGNTLIQFTHQQVGACDLALSKQLSRLFGPCDGAALKAIRDADRMAPYRPGFHENNLAAITTAMVRGLYGVEPDPDQLAAILRTRFETVVGCIKCPDYVPELLERLGRRYKLGIVSNYPDGAAIRESLICSGLARYFSAVVVSADIGLVKPHPRPFISCLDRLGVPADEAVHVGDNWLADVQGAKRLGMAMIRTIQWETPEKFPRQEGDHEPDATVSHLTEIVDLLL